MHVADSVDEETVQVLRSLQRGSCKSVGVTSSLVNTRNWRVPLHVKRRINVAYNSSNAVSGKGPESQEIFDRISALGIDISDVFVTLENEGVQKFEAAWNELLEATGEQLHQAGQKS